MKRTAVMLLSLAVFAGAPSCAAAKETYVQSIQPFWRALARQCPSRHLEYLEPGNLELVIEKFLNRFSEERQAALYTAAQPMCVESQIGVSCSNIAYIRAFIRLRMIRGLAHTACASGFMCKREFDCARAN
jgi:hypothetical protein